MTMQSCACSGEHALCAASDVRVQLTLTLSITVILRVRVRAPARGRASVRVRTGYELDCLEGLGVGFSDKGLGPGCRTRLEQEAAEV